MVEKSAIFIDGGYFNRIIKNHYNEADIDLLEFCKDICKETGTDRLRTYYYHCLPVMRKGHKNKDREKIRRMESYLTKLKRLPRFEVKLGRLQIIGGVFKQKMVDVLMSLDITNLCLSNQIKHAILIAGDSDFVPAIKQAKDSGAIIHLFYHPKTVHNEILDNSDELHEITSQMVKKCKI
ncbi:MAG: NYN domain-containing protein [Candidatus Aminicenantes bacterium]|jgi:uncharacterized LabA/DUF88 family protein